ncbi:hypothetical protein DSO57_1002581 [Entomophthora muscae]|uniref:Uncharacterized protein n=1 Tax=Entomophthora muscae TaxID=34485 RepID=A0ACC2U7E1_9FUNG|nr:hypothetical protein DSO57_1002581 [Entomophthora muscae]
MEEKPQEAQKVVNVVSGEAPCFDGEVEGHPTSIILDGGSTSNIISESFLRSLRVQKYSRVKEKFTFANGKTKECLGTVRDLACKVTFLFSLG